VERFGTGEDTALASYRYVEEEGQEEDEEADLLSHEEKNGAEEIDEIPLRYRKKKSAAREAVTHRPYFTIFICVVDVIVMIVELIVNKGFESMKVNPWLGVSAQTLITLGAKDVPLIMYSNQWWRFITPMFLHVGVIHLALNLLAQVLLGLQLEKPIGTWRTAIIYFVSGVTGNLLSAVFLPLQLEAGASGAIYGLLSYYLADLFVHWSIIDNPRKYAAGLFLSTLFGLLIGLLPGIDNFAHIGGTVGGLFISLLVIPRTLETRSVIRRAKISNILGLPLVLVFCALCIVTVYVPSVHDAVGHCHWCEYMDCLPIFHWCA